MNRTQLEQIFFNLINNSIRYNNKPVAKINISFLEEIDLYRFTVSDNGIGIPTEKQDKIFNLFTTATTADVFGVKGHGIGLPSVQKIVESYGGNITIASESDMGTVISFTIKKPV